MKYPKFICVLMAAAVIMMNALPFNISAESGEMKDSGIDYTESTETINNPCAGYTSTLWYRCKPKDTPVHNPTGNLVLMFVDIGAFSCGANGVKDDAGNYTEGVDYDLDDEFFAGLRATFENCRRNGCTIALRFRYDANGKTNPEPASFEKVLSHIKQIKDSGLLEDYRDILAFVESGFVGAWGEQHSGKYVSIDYKAQLLDAVLDMVPDDIPVTVRTPNIIAKWLDIPANELDKFIAEKGSREARVGLYNDGYMGSDSDLGTFANREIETNWMQNQMRYTYYGGEFSGNLEWTKKFDTYLPENAIPEMYKTHLTYINSNIYSLYSDYTFGEKYDVENVDNSAYYGQTVFKFIRDHLGYRFVLRDSDITAETEQGGIVTVNTKIENTGFANPIKQQKAEIILEKDGTYIKTEVDSDSTQWYSRTVNDIDISVKVPGGIDAGVWNMYYKLSVGNSGIKDSYMRSVKFANNDIWNSSLGANYMGSVEIKESSDKEKLSNNGFYQTNTENASISDGSIFTINNIIITDGQRSSKSEWNEELKCAELENSKLYITNDDSYLYVMADIPQNAEAPVYNIRIENDSDGDSYWLYYQSNGFIYFNKGNHDGCVFKHSGSIAEFRIPFGDVMDIKAGTVLKSVRVFIQDSAADWVLTGEVKSGEYIVSDTFDVYSVMRTVKLRENESFTINAESSLEAAKYQWYFNDEKIDGAENKSYTIENASPDNIGVYSVNIKSSSGTERKVDICNVSDVYSLSRKGDINNDGDIDVFDMIMLKNIIIYGRDYRSEADINNDNAVNVLDIVELKAASHCFE